MRHLVWPRWTSVTSVVRDPPTIHAARWALESAKPPGNDGRRGRNGIIQVPPPAEDVC